MRILCYTRTPLDEAIYAPKLAYSVHLAYETNEGFKPLNHNSGVLFVKATQNPETLEIYPKSLKCPTLCRLPDGRYAVSAIRTEPNGESDESSKGCVVLFVSDNLIDYTELPLVKLCDEHIDDAILTVCKGTGKAVIRYKVGEEIYGRRLNDTLEPCEAVSPCCFGLDEIVTDIEGAQPRNAIEVPDELFDYVTKKLLTPHNTAIELDKTAVDSLDELYTVGATAHYSDGSVARKRIDWMVPRIKLEAGTYTIHGKVHQDHYEFPFATNRADPCITYYNGSYYFIATNDADGNHSLYMRKAASIHELTTAE